MRVRLGTVAYLDAANIGYAIGLDSAGHRVEFIGSWAVLAPPRPLSREAQLRSGLWKLPELWTTSCEVQLRSVAHKLLGHGSSKFSLGPRVHKLPQALGPGYISDDSTIPSKVTFSDGLTSSLTFVSCARTPDLS